MAGAKETPRQKMIGMMYLVLTAMLALNVSVEILEAYKVVNATSVETNINFEKKIADTYASFEALYTIDSTNTAEWYNKALETKRISDKMVDYMVDVRNRLTIAVDGKNKAFYNSETGQVDKEKLSNVPLSELGGLDNTSVCVNFFINNGEAKKLIEEINAFKTDIVKMVKPEDRSKVKIGLDTDKTYWSEAKKQNVSWSEYYFGSSVFAADVVLLNGFIQEIRNVEFDVLSKLRSYVGATDFKFNTVEARVIPLKTNVFKGEEYQAEILVVAYDSTQTPDVLFKTGAKEWKSDYESSAIEVKVKERGKSILKLGTSGYSYGSQSYAGVIKIKSPSGELKDYPFSSEFFVQESSANISADKLNVFYNGLENPVTVSVPGISSDLISCDIKGPGKIVKTGSGRYNVIPSAKSGDIQLTVSISEHGKSKSISSKTFRVKDLPTPASYIAGVGDGGTISKNKIASNPKVEVKMPEDFLFSGIVYSVKGFDVIYSKPGGYQGRESITGSELNREVIQAIEKMSRNSSFMITNIKAVGPGGEQRAASMNITVF